MSTPAAPVPNGTILVHVGFHKTGTTALQSALAAARPALLDNGVCYPGALQSHHRAAMAVTGRTWGWRGKGGRPPKEWYWTSLREEALAHPGRVMISSEALSLASDDAIDRIVGELGAGRLHAIATLRPFAKLLASSYQQYLKYGLDMPYERWLQEVFEAPPKCRPSPNFWRRNDHAGVMARWAERLGPDRVTLVVLDDTDRRGLFRTFEALLGLPDGLLVPDPALGAANRSMTAAEAEMLRLVNAGGAKDWDWSDYQDGVRRGAILHMVEGRRPGPDEPSLATPAWAVQAAQDFGAQTAQRMTDLGITVIGDVERLADPIPAADPLGPDLVLPVQAAAEAVLGAVSGILETRLPVDRADEAEARGARRALERMGTRDAAALLRSRIGQSARRRIPGRHRRRRA